MSWEDRAGCRNHPEPEKWHPSRGPRRGAQVADAIFFCRSECDVRRDCADFALRSRQCSGVWGGVDLGDGYGPLRIAAARALQLAAEGKG